MISELNLMIQKRIRKKLYIRTEFNDSEEDKKKALQNIEESIFYDENLKEIKQFLKEQKKTKRNKT